MSQAKKTTDQADLIKKISQAEAELQKTWQELRAGSQANVRKPRLIRRQIARHLSQLNRLKREAKE